MYQCLRSTGAQYSERTVYHSTVQRVSLCLCSLLAATSPLNALIGQRMQLTGCDNVNNMCDAGCADTQTSIEWPYCSFPIL